MDGWIFRAKRYFTMNLLSDWEKIEASAICFEGEPLAWYQWEDGCQVIRSWEELKCWLLERFHPSQDGSILEKFLPLKQEGTIKEHRRRLEVLADPLPEISDDVMEVKFINELKAPIRAEVRILKPRGLSHIMELAKRVEGHNELLREAPMSYSPNRGRTSFSSPTTYNHNYTRITTHPVCTPQIQ